ncbi:hypothetical protein HYX07_04860 [Candidatus Woesearchaeota archaeon]|nr:hypothetical protein [Candidatus Woesearchaeota archaeon]
MFAKIKETFKKLELGLFEVFLGVLMVIGLAGYFGTISADLDWIDHTISFILFTYLFYKINITSILLGKASRLANFAIIISYFSLFFKDILSYTSSNAPHLKFLIFVKNAYEFLGRDLALANLAAFYLGILGIFLISIYITGKIEISHPSLLYALHQKQIRHRLAKFLLVFASLLGFYYFIFNMILEWLEFVMDDPIIATGAIFFIYKVSKHREKFHSDNFIFKIGDFSTKLYAKFVSLFHYRKTLPLAISGLLILHAVSDLGVFAYSLIFLKENFYLEFLKGSHVPFLRLFLSDIGVLPSFAVIPLLIVYLFNALSLVIFLIIPVIVWIRMFSQKELHLNRICLFFIYSSAAAYMLMPSYIIKPLEQSSLVGVDILSASLLESGSAIDNFFPDKPTMALAVSLIAVSFGLLVYLLSKNNSIKKELYAISIIGGMAFYTIYLYYFFSSLLSYFYDSIVSIIFTPHFLIGIVLLIFLALSALFYIGGYLTFLYEIVKEYHRQKSPEKMDDEMFTAIKKIRKFEKSLFRAKKAQLVGEVFKYALIGMVSVAVIVMGYKMIDVVKERGCRTEIAKFEIELRDMDKSVRYGAKELKAYEAPCNADRIYFFDLNRNINPEDFKEVPIIKDTLKNSGGSNVFIVKNDDVKRSFYAGNLEMVYPYHICFVPKFGKISFFLEGAGKSAKVASACSQPECTFIPIDISDDEARRIVKEAIEFGCSNCPSDFDREIEKIKITRQNVEMFRKFTFCDGITTVEITIRPKKNAEVKNFRFYEFIPKSCIDDLNTYLAENVEGNVEIRADPLIMWQFEDISGEKKISYKLSAELNDECKQAIQGLGISQFIEEKAQEEEIPEENTPPTIGNLPDVSVSGIGLRKNVISNLWKYAQDKETNAQRLVYTIIDQTSKNLVDCAINNEKHIDCEVKQNRDGFSRVTIQVDDFEFQDRAVFNVEVTQFCKRHEKKGCIGDVVFWFDSCQSQEEFVESCSSGEVCREGECEKYCAPNVGKKCEDDKIYWVDSCGKKGSIHFDCRDNLARNQCRNAQCCVGNFFCQTP